ncbi:amino acid deaminase/aldolase [Lysinibacter sp. HNR]|uniref:amino acid deaminase/aldolase n=1 Tax=Lysinibacter sp. HNR TaxID=3031408 RepID=UPI002435E93F|nr:amino acid deaminase/aldolase [Lysinibacter sp. HNR]WGD38653.1 amino acid deaminase/aldolase [Lysinibacter sp. HNR]
MTPAPRGGEEVWKTPEIFWPQLSAATDRLDTPLAVIHLPALRHNAHDMLRRAGGKPIRVASKSVRVRSVLDGVLELPGYSGVLAYTLPEALWLAEGDSAHSPIEDVVVGYPTADREGIQRLAGSAELADRVTLMIDSLAQLDFIDSIVPSSRRETIRVCLELDASWKAPLLGHIGVFRSPLHEPRGLREMAEQIIHRPGFKIVGLMGYEAQIAGQGDNSPGRPLRSIVVRWMQQKSREELLARRAEAVAEVRELIDLEFVNGGGTGSLEFTGGDPSVTEIAAGSGLFGGHLFDTYRGFTPAPAASFALSVVRHPNGKTVTLLGGGWVASGPPGVDRLPRIEWPVGLSMVPREMAGEVQSPLVGESAHALSMGDRVWLRHTKSGELSEHVNEFQVVEAASGGMRVAGAVPSYRGEGKVFL